MAQTIPFLRPRVVPLEAYAQYVARMDATHVYSNSGPLCQEFERRLVSELFTESDSAVTVSNATTGLMLAIAAVRKPGARYAVMPSFTFAATALAAQWAGLVPYFVDIDASCWAASTERVRAAVDVLGEDVAVVVPYATFGTNIDLTFYEKLRESGTPVVIDAAASLGSGTGDENFGAGSPLPFVFSMHATKAFPIGEGGVVVSSDRSLIEMIRRAANFGFGVDRTAEFTGFNAKLPEISCAIALATLTSFAERVSTRRALDRSYRLALDREGGSDWTTQAVRGQVTPQFFPVLAPQGFDRDGIISVLEDRGIQARTYFSPACHQQQIFSNCPSDELAVTQDVSERIVSLPLWEGMSEADVDRIVHALLA